MLEKLAASSYDTNSYIASPQSSSGGSDFLRQLFAWAVFILIIYVVCAVVKEAWRKTGNFLKNTGIADKFDDPRAYKAKQSQEGSHDTREQAIMQKIQANQLLTTFEWDYIMRKVGVNRGSE